MGQTRQNELAAEGGPAIGVGLLCSLIVSQTLSTSAAPLVKDPPAKDESLSISSAVGGRTGSGGQLTSTSA